MINQHHHSADQLINLRALRHWGWEIDAMLIRHILLVKYSEMRIKTVGFGCWLWFQFNWFKLPLISHTYFLHALIIGMRGELHI